VTDPNPGADQAMKPDVPVLLLGTGRPLTQGGRPASVTEPEQTTEPARSPDPQARIPKPANDPRTPVPRPPARSSGANSRLPQES